MHEIPSPDLTIQRILDACSPNALPHFLAIRQLIFDVAAKDPSIGPLTETLKWGQISYLTSATKSGTTLRLGWHKDNANFISLFVHCQTSLVGAWRDLHEDQLTLIGNRELRLPIAAPLPEDILAHCIQMTLTYHARKKPD